MRNILVVDDSALMRRVICDIINTDGTFQANDVCRDGLEAYEKLKTTKYAGVILDVNMPRMDGLQLLEKLQQDKIKATVIMVSTQTTKDADVTIRAMERGAIDFVEKPTNIVEAKGESFRNRLLDVLSAVLRTERENLTMQTKKPEVVLRRQKPVAKSGNLIVALACSTGGPKALQSVIPKLPKNLNAPVVLVQHMPVGFTYSLGARLDELSQIHVKEAEDGEVLCKGTVYIAKGGSQMRVIEKNRREYVLSVREEEARNGLKPCADIMYESLRESSFDDITCVVMTGMGADGTKGILQLEKTNKIYVIAQNEESCTVYGMPKVVTESGVVDEVQDLNLIADAITKHVGVR